mmetsp:Transcript_4278/g.7275  ORF Transcript_4278/g.7275 Transcript_4278/m.7275 type:complete len:371 (+) Transcript_4278:143-1255(+)
MRPPCVPHAPLDGRHPMRVLVTGGSGYLGSWVLHRLCGAQHGRLEGAPSVEELLTMVEEVAYTYFSTEVPPSAFLQLTARPPRAMQVDITDSAAVAEVINEFRPDVVVHLAAWVRTVQCESDPARAYAVHVTGTENLVSALRNFPAKIVFLSSSWIYSPLSAVPIVEDAICAGFGVYGKTKLLGEQVVRMSGLPYTVLRSDIIYGSPAPFTGLVAFNQFIIDGLRECKPLSLYSNEIKTPVYVRDLVDCIILSLHSQGPTTDAVFNVGSSSCISVSDFGWAVCDALSLDRSNAHLVASNSPNVASGTRPSNTSLNVDHLVFTLGVKLSDVNNGLRSTVEDIQFFAKAADQEYRWAVVKSEDEKRVDQTER